MNAGTALRASVDRGRLDPATAAYVGLGNAWRNNQPAAFNAIVKDSAPGWTARFPA